MLYVVRHGETDYNVARRICGHAEAQLTEKGYQQAELVAEKIAKQGIQIDRLLASPLKRAQETARKIAERNQLTIETEPRLIEMNFGIYDGEPVLDVAGRIYPLIEEALASEETYLFVCHNAVMRVIDNYFNGKKIQDFLDFHCENTQLVQYGE